MTPRAFLRRLANALRYVASGTPMPQQAAPEARAGLLNSGELIVLLPGGAQLLLSAETTHLVRDVLDADANALNHLPLPVGPRLHDLARGTSDPVHDLLRERAGR